MRLELDCQGVKWCKSEGVICSATAKRGKSWAARGARVMW